MLSLRTDEKCMNTVIDAKEKVGLRELAAALASLAVLFGVGACGGTSSMPITGSAQRDAAESSPSINAIKSEWNESTTTSGIDGTSITRSKVFKVGDGGSNVLVKLSCLQKDKMLKMTVESYGSDGSSPSRLVTEHGLLGWIPSGREKLADNEPTALTSFTIDSYSNVMTWDISDSARAYILDQYQARRNAAITAFAEKHSETATTATVSYSPQTRNLAVFKDIEIEKWNALEDKLGKQKVNKAFADYTGGNYMSIVLPIVVEASNEQGTFEIQIPKGDAGINSLASACAGKGLTHAEMDALFNFEDVAVAVDPPISSAGPVATANSAPSSGVDNAGSSPPTAESTSKASVSSVAASESGSRPSFDCTKASTQVEKLICSSSALSQADSDMAGEYRRMYSTPGADSNLIKQGQREFIAKRNLCTTEECVAEAYKARRIVLAHLGP
jgi:hypothetical protein